MMKLVALFRKNRLSAALAFMTGVVSLMVATGGAPCSAAPLPPPSVTVYVRYVPVGTQLGTIELDLLYGSGVVFGSGAFINEGTQFNNSIVNHPADSFVRAVGLTSGAVTVSANPLVELNFTATPSTSPIGGFSINPATLQAIDPSLKNLNPTPDNFPLFISSPARLSNRTSPLNFTDLQSLLAATDLMNLDTVQATAAVNPGNVNFDRDLAVTIEGGFDPFYTTQTGYTSVAGVMTVAQGTVTADRLAIQ